MSRLSISGDLSGPSAGQRMSIDGPDEHRRAGWASEGHQRSLMSIAGGGGVWWGCGGMSMSGAG